MKNYFREAGDLSDSNNSYGSEEKMNKYFKPAGELSNSDYSYGSEDEMNKYFKEAGNITSEVDLQSTSGKGRRR